MRQHVTAEYHFKMYHYLEADDVCGILMTGPNHGDKVVVSIDKDFHGIPGAYYNLDRDEETFATQLSDGFPGCPTIGPKRADRLLDGLDPEDWWPAVVAAYEKQGLDEERALMIARVARTLRYDEYNQITNEIELWSPSEFKEKTVLSVV
jgi:DNA polymerase-1